MYSWRTIYLASLVTLLGTVRNVQAADVLYATGVGSGAGAGLSALYAIDPSTGTSSLLWNFPSIHIYGGGLAYDVASDSLFATGATINSVEALYKIDRFTGTTTFVGFTGNAALSQGGLSIDPTTGIMYAVGENGFQNSGFFSINKATGASTLIGQVAALPRQAHLYGLGFRSDGTLFGNGFEGTNDSKLYSVTPSSGAATVIGLHGVGLGRALKYSGLAFRQDGVMLSLGSISASRSGLYSVDQATGAATLIGDTVIQFGVDGGLVFAPGVVPEPATLVTLGIGALALLRRRQSKVGIDQFPS